MVCPRTSDSSVKPAACHLLCRGGFIKLSPLTEEMPDRAEEYSVSLEKGDVSVADRGIYKEFSFFFSLLKRKKEAKKEKLTAYPCSERQCITRLAV